MKELFSEPTPGQIIDECIATEQKGVDEYELLIMMPTIPRKLRDLLNSQREAVVTEIANLELARVNLG